MQTIKSFLNQSLLIWKDTTGAGRLGIVLLLVICVGAIIGVGVWSAQPNYVVLVNDIDPTEAAKMIDALDAARITYQVKGSGSMILVDKKKWSRAKIAAGKLGINSVEPEIKETPPWMDPATQRDTRRSNTERKLESTIARFKSIESADVHLSIPEHQSFLRESSAASAAVMITLKPKARFGESNALSIASLVASSVSGLKEDQVSISDTSGNVYSTDPTLGQLNKQEEFRLMRERSLTQKAQSILMPFLGHGNSSVAVTADFTFPMGTQTTKEIDPDNKVLVDESVKNETSSLGDSVASGVAGSASNTRARASNRTNSDRVVSKKEDLNNTYEFSSTSRTETIQTPVLNMLTVSVLVNKKSVQNSENVVPPEFQKKVETLVRQAVGLRDTKDQISVEFFEFLEDSTDEAPATTAIPWDQINTILKNISLGLAALVALFIAWRVFKKLPAGSATSGNGSEQTQQISELSEMVKQNPEVFSKIIASWSSQSPSQDENQAEAA